MCIDICTINIRVSIRVRGLQLVFWFCIVSWMPKQKSNVQTALKKMIMFNGFANQEYIYIYIWFVTRKKIH